MPNNDNDDAATSLIKMLTDVARDGVNDKEGKLHPPSYLMNAAHLLHDHGMIHSGAFGCVRRSVDAGSYDEAARILTPPNTAITIRTWPGQLTDVKMEETALNAAGEYYHNGGKHLSIDGSSRNPAIAIVCTALRLWLGMKLRDEGWTLPCRKPDITEG